MNNSISGVPSSVLNELNRLTTRGINVNDIGAGQGTPEVNFKDLIVQSIGQVNEMQLNADQAIETLVTGGDVNPAEVFTAIQKADMSFRMMQQIRNKLLDAYREIKEIRI